LGRRNTYFLSFSLFVVFSIISAVGVNIAMLIVMRILSGAAAASVQAVGAGTVADIWEPKERGRAMGVFYLGPLCGPVNVGFLIPMKSRDWLLTIEPLCKTLQKASLSFALGNLPEMAMIASLGVPWLGLTASCSSGGLCRGGAGGSNSHGGVCLSTL